MDSNNAVSSSQPSVQMNTAIPNEAYTVISADPGRPTDIPELVTTDQTGTPAEDTTPDSQRVTVMPDPFGLLELWSGGKVQDPLRHKAIDLFNEVCDDLGKDQKGRRGITGSPLFRDTSIGPFPQRLLWLLLRAEPKCPPMNHADRHAGITPGRRRRTHPRRNSRPALPARRRVRPFH